MAKSQDSLTDYFKSISTITILNSGQKLSFFKGDDKFELIFSELISITNNSHDMPAFAVSLHDETIKELATGIWVELGFNETQTFREMPFDTLLFSLKENNTGLNLIRKHNGKYEGRCFYLNLNKNFNDLIKLSLKFFNTYF